MFPNLSRDASFFLGFDLASHVVAYLLCGHMYSSEEAKYDVDLNLSNSNLSQKENDIISYLGGYVFGTFSRRIRNSKKWQSLPCQHCLSILLSGRTSGNHGEQTLFNVRNLGGLWKVRKVCNIFSVCEQMFR